jgi:fermentation-respiration switch protein FrsA (DUF1100 family)
MKLISWNVNGFRSVLTKGFEEIFNTFDSDFFCIQETKMKENQADFNPAGYFSYLFSAEKAGYSGTGIFAKKEPLSVSYGIEGKHTNEGRVITFGINESRDCLSWVDFAVKHFGSDVKLILTGISMGAATVCIAAGECLPENVVGVLADCGYSSPKAIIKKVIADMKLPPSLAYPFVLLGARLFGRFDLEKFSPVESLKNTKLPVIFFHGDADDFVPCEMSKENYDACTGAKKFVVVKGAGHGMAYLVEPEGYLEKVAEFFSENGVETKVIH